MGCSDDWYVTKFYSSSPYSVLQPAAAANCGTASDSSFDTDDWVLELAYIVVITMLVGLTFLGMVLVRSMSSIYVDWFRLVLYYIIATMAVPISLISGPSQGGFNRVIAFGIMIHNLSEWFIIDRIWIGQAYINALPAVIYVSIFLIMIAIMPLQPLFLIAMIQGAFCDWTLVYSFFYMRHWLQDHQGDMFQKDTVCYSWLGFSGALLHILSIQPLFIGIATTYSVIDGITVVFLFPTFVLYTFYASNGGRKVQANIVAPTFHTAQFILTRSIYNTLQVAIGGRPIGRPTDDDEKYNLLGGLKSETDLKPEEKEEKLQVAVKHDGKTDERTMPAGEFEGLEMSFLQGRGIGMIKEDKRERADSSFADLTHGMSSATINQLKKNIYTLVIYFGLVKLDPPTNDKWMKIIFIGAACTAVVNSLIAFLMPCMIDIDALVC